MFFILSKVFWFVAQPVSVVFLLVLLGMVLAGFGRRRLGMVAAGLGVLLLGLVSYTTVGEVMISPLENRFARPEVMPQDVSTILLLGGSTSGRISAARGMSEFSDAADRPIEALRLARVYPQAQILATGGVGQLLSQGAETEAVTTERFLRGMGLPPDRFMLEDASRNTAENAQFTAEMLVGREGTMLLVTSAFHIPRSMGLFRKAGLDPIAWPVDYRSTGTEVFRIDLTDPVVNIETTTIALREWIGLLAYNWTGQTDALLPGPEDQPSN